MAATSTCLTPAGGSAWSQNSAVQRRESGGVGSEWADAKAREWWDKVNPPDTDPVDDLAALLREVRKDTLAEVRKIVEDVRANHPPARECFDAWMSCDEILRRIEGLDG